jgi:hypothetical protein
MNTRSRRSKFPGRRLLRQLNAGAITPAQFRAAISALPNSSPTDASKSAPVSVRDAAVNEALGRADQ